MGKQITLEQAAAKVKSGDTLALGGMTLYRRPMAFVRALIAKQKKTGAPSDLTLLTFTASIESDFLLGAGMVSRVRTCYFGLEIFGLAPVFTHLVGTGQVEIVEETEASIANGLRAQMANIGFMPARAWLGTDLPTLRPDVQTVTDPYSGEKLMAFPAIKPTVAIIHALKADQQGNAMIGRNKGVDEELSLASDLVIVTAEEIIPELTRADLVAPVVDYVVAAPKGALPTSCHPLYPLDGMAIMSYSESVSDPESFSSYLQRYE